MRVVKVLAEQSSTFDSAIAPWECVEVVRTADAVPKGEKFIKHRDGAWFVYRKSRVHLATPRYIGRYVNLLSAVHAARVV
jgi:hypothetical protein